MFLNSVVGRRRGEIAYEKAANTMSPQAVGRSAVRTHRAMRASWTQAEIRLCDYRLQMTRWTIGGFHTAGTGVVPVPGGVELLLVDVRICPMTSWRTRAGRRWAAKI